MENSFNDCILVENDLEKNLDNMIHNASNSIQTNSAILMVLAGKEQQTVIPLKITDARKMLKNKFNLNRPATKINQPKSADITAQSNQTQNLNRKNNDLICYFSLINSFNG